jgi:type IV pilus assembly protein PilQ
MRREYLRSMAMRGLILGLLCASAGLGVAATPPASLKSVSLNQPAAGEQLILRIEGDYSFRASQASQNTVLIDLMGVEAGDVAAQANWTGGLVKGYSLLQYTNAAHVPVTHLKLALSHSSPFHAVQTPEGLRVDFDRGSRPQEHEAASAQALTPAGSSAPASAEIEQISVKDDVDGQTVVNVATTGHADYRAFRLENPPRLVLDFQGAHRVPSERTYRSQSGVLTDVRVGKFRSQDPAVVRVVADLIGDPAYEVQPVADGVRVVLRSRTSKSQPVPVSASPSIETAKLSNPGPSVSASRTAAADVAAEAAPATSKSEKPVPAAASLDNALPGNTLAVSASPKPGVAPEPSEALRARKAAQIMAASTPEVSEAAAQNPAGSDSSSAAPQYTGEPISLNLKDVDLKDFFRLIHEISGLNIIIDPNVTGTVTLVLDNVPWDQALDIVLKDNQLGKTLEGNVLRIAKLSTLTAEEANAAKLAQAREEAQPLVTKFVPVNYAKASQIASMLKSWVGGGALSKRGNILVDDRTNTLIVSDIASQIPIILPIIAKLDTKTKQVAIEARIERVTRDFQRTLSNALSIGYQNKSGTSTMAGLSGNSSTASNSLATPLPINVSSTSGGGFGVYAISNIGARYIINDVLAAAESNDKAKTISKPTIVTQNNVAGKVLQGTQIPIQTTINNTISITYVQASLQLTVTPQVTSDGNIFLVIDVQNSTPGAALTTAGPSINTQQATTQVLVPDGGTVIFGGVTVNQVTSSANYVPLLGKIPVLGNLFKSSVKTQNDQELLFFVSPKILPG